MATCQGVCCMSPYAFRESTKVREGAFRQAKVPSKPRAMSFSTRVDQYWFGRRWERTMRILGTAVVALVIFGSSAMAQDRCLDRLNDLVNHWRSIAVPGPAKSSQSKVDSGSHKHTAREVTFMRNQIRLALELCKDNKEHEAMLRMDVVQAWLKLPEVQHPKDHRYTFEPRKPGP